MTRFVTTPTCEWLDEVIQLCETRFLVSSPYVSGFLPMLSQRVSPKARKTLLTRTDLRDFAMGASDVDALCTLARDGTEILSCYRLHAKVYIVDDKCALITSANATDGGMRRNWECGVCVDEASAVDQVASLLLGGFGTPELPQVWDTNELDMLRYPIRTLREQLPSITHLSELDAAEVPLIKLSRSDRTALLEGFSGWMKLTLEGILSQPDDVFSLDALFTTCQPSVAASYPKNRNVRPKIRQQLQRLRDLGLVEFRGGGSYRRTLHS